LGHGLPAALRNGGQAPPPASEQARSPGPSARRGGTERPRQGAFRVDAGVLTEAKVVEIGRTHAGIVAGCGVVVTPLARDKARELKLEIVRQKP
jgi:hypothetical protein